MSPDKPATIILDESLMRKAPPLIELEALVSHAVALLACRKEAISATIFRKPAGKSYWVSLMDGGRKIIGLMELWPQAPVVDFEIINRAVSDLLI